MLTKKGVALTFYAFYVASKTGKTGLTVTVDVYEQTTATPIVSGGSATEIGGGLYYYTLASGSVDAAGGYVAVFKTTDSSVDQQHIPALWVTDTELLNLDAAVSSRPTAAATATAVRSELATELGRVDAAVSTRLAAASYSAAPSAATVADAVADEVMADHTVPGSLAVLVSAAGSAADPLLNDVPGVYPSGSAGNALGRIASGQLTIVQSVLADGYVRIVPGDDYAAADGTAKDLSNDGWPTLTGAVITWTIGSTSYTGSVVDADTVRLELTAAQSTALGAAEPGRGYYTVVAVLSSGRKTTLVKDAPVLVG